MKIPKKNKESKEYVLAKCITCNATRKIKPGEVSGDDMPVCKVCFSPMIAVKAYSK